MLFVSTRNKTDSFTAYRVLQSDRASDGGCFAPFRLPHFSEEEITALKDKSFSEIVAGILNTFFSRNITSWDVEFSIGRTPFRLEKIGQKVTFAELWHNSASNYSYLVTNLYRNLYGEGSGNATQWAYIAIEIAILFGLYGELLRNDADVMDISVSDDNLNDLLAVWYAREMGLPVGMIICGCVAYKSLWDFIRKGEASANIPAETQLLIYETLGFDEANRFISSRDNGRIYRLNEVSTGNLNKGIYTFVVGDERIPAVTASIQRTFEYQVDPATAAAYGALQDYRAASGENRHTLILTRCNGKG